MLEELKITGTNEKRDRIYSLYSNKKEIIRNFTKTFNPVKEIFKEFFIMKVKRFFKQFKDNSNRIIRS